MVCYQGSSVHYFKGPPYAISAFLQVYHYDTRGVFFMMKIISYFLIDGKGILL